MWGRTLGESWPPESTSSHASIDFWCQLVASPATTASWMSVVSNGGLRILGWIGQLLCLTIFSTSLSVAAFLHRAGGSMLVSTGSHGRNVEWRVPEMRRMVEFNCTSTWLVWTENALANTFKFNLVNHSQIIFTIWHFENPHSPTMQLKKIMWTTDLRWRWSTESQINLRDGLSLKKLCTSTRKDDKPWIGMRADINSVTHTTAFLRRRSCRVKNRKN